MILTDNWAYDKLPEDVLDIASTGIAYFLELVAPIGANQGIVLGFVIDGTAWEQGWAHPDSAGYNRRKLACEIREINRAVLV